jgi:hypothetical protein
MPRGGRFLRRSRAATGRTMQTLGGAAELHHTSDTLMWLCGCFLSDPHSAGGGGGGDLRKSHGNKTRLYYLRANL